MHEVRGPITKLEIRHAAEVDGIKVYYAGSPATFHGGGGGSLSTWDVPEGYQIVRIKGRAEDRIDRLQFIAFNKAENKYISSPEYGGGGGIPFDVLSPGGNLPLRFIEGRSQHRLDQVTFIFGYPYRIGNLKIDEDALSKQLLTIQPAQIDKVEISNPTNHEIEGGAYENTEATSQTHTFDWGTSVAFTYGQKTEVGLTGDIVTARAEVSWSISASVTIGGSQSYTQAGSRTWRIPFTVPPRSEMTIQVFARKGHLSQVPFHYDVEFYDPKTDSVVHRVREMGKYSGILVSDIRFVPHTSPLS